MKYVLAVDLGATKVAAGIYDQNLNLIHQSTTPSRLSLDGLADPGLARTKDLIQEMLNYAASNEVQLVAGGIGFPEYVSAQGLLTSKDCVGWDEQPKQQLPLLAGFPWVVESDVRCAALGEAALGAGSSYDDFLYITISSGISHALVLSGKPWSGFRGRAIGFGVMEVEYKSEFRTLESISSGLGIAREFVKRSGIEVTGAKEVLARVDHDEIAAEVVSDAAKILAREISNIVEVLDPAKVIIGGGLWLGSNHYQELIRINLAKATEELILSAKLSDAGLIGAAIAASAALGQNL